MNEARYQELAGRVLDDEASRAELDELSQNLRQQPDPLADLQFHLVLWGLFSQQHRPERNADAFVAAWQTRLAAETHSAPFVNRLMKAVETDAELSEAAPPTTVKPIVRKSGLVARIVAQISNLLYRRFVIGRPPDRALDSKSGIRQPARGPRRLQACDTAESWRIATKSALQSRPWALAIGTAACLILVVSLGLWWLGPAIGEPMLADVQGSGLSLERDGRILATIPGTRLQPGDLLRTPGNVAATITFASENTRVTINPNASLKVLNWKPAKRFELRQGKIGATVAHQPKDHSMVWRTAQAEATVVGTELTLESATNGTRLEVIEGKVKLTSLENGQAIEVTNSQYAIAAPGTDLKPQWFSGGLGTILREYWLGVEGYHVGNLTHHSRYPDQPSGQEYPSSFTGPTNWAVNYGARFRGYLHPPKTGAYTFWISANQSAQLWLGSDETSGHVELLASLSQSTGGQWEKYPWQRSYPVTLEAGRKYYIEVLHKAEYTGGGDYCSVAWQPPGLRREVIPGRVLSPFTSATEKKMP